MLTTSLVQLWSIRLDPTPDAAGVYRYAPFRYDLGDMLVSQRIAKVPPHTQKNQLARVLASLERVGRGDRHEIPSLPNLVPKLRNRTVAAYHGPEAAPLTLKGPEGSVEIEALGTGMVIWDNGKVTVEGLNLKGTPRVTGGRLASQ
jgi:hypothetical protein